MFVSHFYSFLFYLYVSALVQLENCLARDKSFLGIPNMPWFHRTKVVHARARYKTHTMTISPWPLPVEMPRKRSTLWGIRLMGNNPPSKQIFFGGVERVNIHRSAPLFWQWCDASPQHRSVLRANTPYPYPPKTYFPLLGESLPIEQRWRRAQGASCATLGDQFRQRHCLMVIVDRWHQIIFIPT
jgi:hypothetical protein